MLELLKRARKRWLLRPVVSRLPAELHRSHGRADFYAAPQVGVAATKLQFEAELLPYAYAVACRAEERKREELAQKLIAMLEQERGCPLPEGPEDAVPAAL